MSKIIYLIIIILIAWIIYWKFPRKSTKIISQKIVNKSFSLEIANTVFLQGKGLSGRDKLCPNCGMIFIFNNEDIRSFWMKNTLIPLDMIFLNQKGQVSDIFTAQPEPNKSDFQLKIYQSTLPAKYVIEINAGISERIGLKPGMQISLNI